MHVQVNIHAQNKTFFCSFLYADNYYVNRQALWSNLICHARFTRRRLWVLFADFNYALNLKDHSCGGYVPIIAMRKYKDCVQSMEVADVNSTWLHFTWSQKPKGFNSTLQFSDTFLGSFAIFQPYRILDPSPCVLRNPKVAKPKPKPFKFSNFLIHEEGFQEMVASRWNLSVNGCTCYVSCC